MPPAQRSRPFERRAKFSPQWRMLGLLICACTSCQRPEPTHAAEGVKRGPPVEYTSAAPTPEPVVTRSSAVSAAPSAPAASATPQKPRTWRTATEPVATDAFVAALFETSGVAQMIAPQLGVTVVRTLTCERERPLTRTHHLCGSAAELELRPLLTAARSRLRDSTEDPEVACGGEPLRCTVEPTMECEPRYEFVFDGRDLVLAVERDDWQLPESEAASEAQIRQILAAPGRCTK